MMVIWNNEKLRVFVKDTLGCGCPEKVFEKIDVSDLHIEEHGTKITRIVVGDTLLVYIIGPELPGDYAENIKSIGLAGKNDRDANNYNRFRLVVPDFADEVQQEKASANFSRSFNRDEKMHIHFVDQVLIEGLD